jgi:hypothetical protein
LLPAAIAKVALAGGSSGIPDVVVWDPDEPRPMFVEAKGPGDHGINQAAWVARARRARAVKFDHFVLLVWEFRGD